MKYISKFLKLGELWFSEIAKFVSDYSLYFSQENKKADVENSKKKKRKRNLTQSKVLVNQDLLLFYMKCLHNYTCVFAFPISSTGSVPYITTPCHLQESIASSSHLHHLWACFLLCHRLPCTAFYGPVSIPSILYLAYLQLESHECFCFDYNKIWGKQR
jgi:hypothetical protein